MGDLFFIFKMAIYTLILIVVMQIKIGSTTVEQKVIEVTHNSQLADFTRNIAQGAANFLGVQYRNATGHLNSKYLKKYSEGQRPGSRLKVKLQELRDSLDEQWKESSEKMEEVDPKKIQEELDL